MYIDKCLNPDLESMLLLVSSWKDVERCWLTFACLKIVYPVKLSIWSTQDRGLEGKHQALKLLFFISFIYSYINKSIEPTTQLGIIIFSAISSSMIHIDFPNQIESNNQSLYELMSLINQLIDQFMNSITNQLIHQTITIYQSIN